MAIGESKKELRTTWIGFAVLFVLLGSISLFKKKTGWPYFYGVSAFFSFFAAFAPFALMPLYRLWVKFATVMAWINTKLLLAIVFYLVVTPTGRLMRLLGKDLLDEKIDKTTATYWNKKEHDKTADYENQY